VIPVYTIPNRLRDTILSTSAVPVNNNTSVFDITQEIIDPLIGVLIVGNDGGILSIIHVTLPVAIFGEGFQGK
jgi:hypothetical protein